MSIIRRKKLFSYLILKLNFLSDQLQYGEIRNYAAVGREISRVTQVFLLLAELSLNHEGSVIKV
jgi:hypothetical protein